MRRLKFEVYLQREGIVVPKLTGMPIAEARRELGRPGLRLKVVGYEDCAADSQGIVLWHHPGPTDHTKSRSVYVVLGGPGRADARSCGCWSQGGQCAALKFGVPD